MKILFTGGGSGGHIVPIVAIAREIKMMQQKNVELLYMGPKDEWVDLFSLEKEMKIRGILSGKLRRQWGPQEILLNILDVFKLLIGIIQAFFWVFIEGPDLIFSKGGYGSVPVILSAKILQVPIFLHESDIIPGLSNRILGKTALGIFVSFPKTEYFEPKKMILAGNPTRKEIFGGSKEQAKELLGLTNEKPIIFIYPGSQGAQAINDLLLSILPELLMEFEVIHYCGIKNFKQIRAESKLVIQKGLEKYYHLFSFVREHELREIYAAADIIVSRAGAANIFEIAALEKPSILIPLPSAAQNHQTANAYAFAKNGASIVIEQTNLTPHMFLTKLRFLISSPDLLKKMSQKAKEFSKPGAAKMIADYLLEYLTTQ